MTNNSENDNENQVLATFDFNNNLMLEALRNFLQTLHEGGVVPEGEQVKYTLSGYLVEALAVTIATFTEVGEGEDEAYIFAAHTAKRIVERLHHKWHRDLQEEAQAKCKSDDVELADLKPQGRA
ncbi:MAG: hypothetical protein OEL53_07325 [Rhodospirillales bacterium]|nr:hypothetical protein [Rhodospirillales bacterium]